MDNLIRERINQHDYSGYCKNQNILDNGANQGHSIQLSKIILCRFYVSASYALSNYGNENWSHCHSNHCGQGPKTLCNSIGSDLRGAKKCCDTAECYLYKLKQTVFDPVWDCNFQYAPNHYRMPCPNILPLIGDSLGLIEAHGSHDHGGKIQAIRVGYATPATPAWSRKIPMALPVTLMIFAVMETFIVKSVRPQLRDILICSL